MGTLETVVRRVLVAAGMQYERFSVLELVRREIAGDGRVLLVFLDGGNDPQVFVKVGSSEHRRSRLEKEYSNLQLLQRAGSPGLLRTVPRPLFLGECGGFDVSAQSALPGTRMKDFAPDSYFPSARFLQHLEGILDWLEEFRRSLSDACTEQRPDADAEIETFRRGFERSAALDRLLDESAAYLRGEALPPSPGHGDFNTANVLVAGDDRIRVIDWELPLGGGWPLGDLLYFVSSVWCIPYGKGAETREANYRRVFFETTPLTDRLIDGVARSAHALGLRGESLLPLSVLIWTSYANRKRAALAPHGLIPDGLSAAAFPLLIVRGGHCRNLEMLAEMGDRYRPRHA